MSKSNYWQRSTISFNLTEVADVLQNFKSEDLADPNSAKRWIEFAKRISQMNLTASDIEQLGFKNFYALKQVMAATLSALSQETVRQHEKIQTLEKEERVLKRDFDNLTRIEEENSRKEQKLKEEFDRLQKKEEDLSIKYNEEDQSYGEI